MKTSKKLAAAGVAALCIYLAASGGLAARARDAVLRGIGAERMKNVSVVTDMTARPASVQTEFIACARRGLTSGSARTSRKSS